MGGVPCVEVCTVSMGCVPCVCVGVLCVGVCGVCMGVLGYRVGWQHNRAITGGCLSQHSSQNNSLSLLH